MEILNYFKPVPTKSVKEVKEFLKSRDAGEYNLIDVRQPMEYERGHIPGALLIPLGELRDRVSELDPDKPTITY